MGVLITLIIIIIISFAISSFVKGVRKIDIQDEERKRQMAEQRKQEEDKFLQIKDSFIEKYGEPDKIINLNKWKEYIISKLIWVFAQPSIVVIGDKELPFSDIASYKIIDNYEIKHGEVNGSLDTKTNTGSLVGRTVGGAIVGGGVGAVIGASSASKNSAINYTQGNDELVHNYTLIVATKSFANPTIEFNIGNKWKEAAEIDAVFNLIIEQNQK